MKHFCRDGNVSKDKSLVRMSVLVTESWCRKIWNLRYIAHHQSMRFVALKWAAKHQISINVSNEIIDFFFCLQIYYKFWPCQLLGFPNECRSPFRLWSEKSSIVFTCSLHNDWKNVSHGRQCVFVGLKASRYQMTTLIERAGAIDLPLWKDFELKLAACVTKI